jgi:hypothetical protein
MNDPNGIFSVIKLILIDVPSIFVILLKLIFDVIHI